MIKEETNLGSGLMKRNPNLKLKKFFILK